MSVGRFSTEEEAIALANDTSYGLGAGLHSSTPSDPSQFMSPDVSQDDANQCMRVSSALEAGTVCFISILRYDSVRDTESIQVWVNQYNILNNNVPFGGKKQSGIGAAYTFPVNQPD